MATHPTSIHPLKALAAQVRNVLAQQHGYKLRVSESLELVSKAAGHPNWDTACATYPANARVQPTPMAQAVARLLASEHGQTITSHTASLLAGAVESCIQPDASLNDHGVRPQLPSSTLDPSRNSVILSPESPDKCNALAMMSASHYARGGCVILLSDSPLTDDKIESHKRALGPSHSLIRLDFKSSDVDVSTIMSGLLTALKEPGLVVIQCPKDGPYGRSVAAAALAAISEALFFLRSANALLPCYLLFSNVASETAMLYAAGLQRQGRKLNLACCFSSNLVLDPRRLDDAFGGHASSILANAYNVIVCGPVEPAAAQALVNRNVIPMGDRALVESMLTGQAYVATPKGTVVGDFGSGRS